MFPRRAGKKITEIQGITIEHAHTGKHAQMLESISLFENKNICVYKRQYQSGKYMCDKSYAMLLGKCKWVVEGE